MLPRARKQKRRFPFKEQLSDVCVYEKVILFVKSNEKIERGDTDGIGALSQLHA